MKHQCNLIKVLNIGIACFWFLATLSVMVGLSSNPAEAQPFLYVTNPDSATVSVIDTNPSSPHYNKVVSTITGPGVVKVPGRPHPLNGMSSPFFIAITPDGTRGYVSNIWSNTVSVIDTDPASTDFNMVVSTIETPRYPQVIAITPDGTRAYVTSSGTSVLVIDTDPSSTDFNKVVSKITGLGMTPLIIAFTPDGTRAYVTSSGTSVFVIDTDPSSTDFNKVVSKIEVGRASVFVAITPDGTRAYLTNKWDGTVSVIDTDPNSTDFNKVVSIIDAGPKPFGINITPDGTRAYVTFFYCTYTLTRECRSGVRVIDTETDTWIDTIEDLGLFANIIAFTPDGARAYLAPYKSPVRVIDTSDNSVVDTIKMDRGPFGPYGPYWAAIAPSVAKNKEAEVSLRVSCRKGANCTRGNSSAH